MSERDRERGLTIIRCDVGWCRADVRPGSRGSIPQQRRVVRGGGAAAAAIVSKHASGALVDQHHAELRGRKLSKKKYRIPIQNRAVLKGSIPLLCSRRKQYRIPMQNRAVHKGNTGRSSHRRHDRKRPRHHRCALARSLCVSLCLSVSLCVSLRLSESLCVR